MIVVPFNVLQRPQVTRTCVLVLRIDRQIISNYTIPRTKGTWIALNHESLPVGLSLRQDIRYRTPKGRPENEHLIRHRIFETDHSNNNSPKRKKTRLRTRNWSLGMQGLKGHLKRTFYIGKQYRGHDIVQKKRISLISPTRRFESPLKEQLPLETQQTKEHHYTSHLRGQHDDISHWWRNINVKVTAGLSIAMDCVTCSGHGRKRGCGGRVCGGGRGEGEWLSTGAPVPSLTFLLYLLCV